MKTAFSRDYIYLERFEVQLSAVMLPPQHAAHALRVLTVRSRSLLGWDAMSVLVAAATISQRVLSSVFCRAPRPRRSTRQLCSQPFRNSLTYLSTCNLYPLSEYVTVRCPLQACLPRRSGQSTCSGSLLQSPTSGPPQQLASFHPSISVSSDSQDLRRLFSPKSTSETRSPDT